MYPQIPASPDFPEIERGILAWDDGTLEPLDGGRTR